VKTKKRCAKKVLAVVRSVLAVGAIVTTTPKESLAQDAAKPNIVILMSDNQGYGDLGCYGGLRANTPRIDQLASEGVQFMDFQVEPGCTPTRAAFMTGRMPIRSGCSGYVEPGQPGGLHPKEVTIAELLKGTGYSTANYGKWHLGESHDRSPHTQGFDEWYGVANTSIPIDPGFPGVDTSLLNPQKIVHAKAGGKAKVVDTMTLERRATIDRTLTEKSVAFIKAQAKSDKPFFLLTTFINPHHPAVPHPDFAGKSEGGAYTDCLMELDRNTGAILDAIDDTGIRGNTIVIYFSDNGPTRYSPEVDHNGDNGPWSGELGSAWEGSLRTVGMMRWPGKIRAGWKCKQIVHVMDLYVTLGAMADAVIPDDRPLDGFDQTDFLLGKSEESARDHRLVFYLGKLTAIRWNQFKAHFVLYEKENSLVSPAKDLGQIPVMFNLAADPKERSDIFGRSGGTPLFEPMMKVAAPYVTSFRQYPNKDYSKFKRGE